MRQLGPVRWVIVAHPDDELIFAGGAMLRRRKEAWRVVVATHVEGSPRAAESLAARDGLRALGVDVGYVFLGEADDPQHPTGGIDLARARSVLERLGVGPGERVYTHGAPGEYGHNAHKAVHHIVAGVLAGRAVISCFSGGTKVIELIDDPGALALKAELFNRAYVSQRGIWVGLADTMREAMARELHFALERQRQD